jgi:hypothetical protein
MPPEVLWEHKEAAVCLMNPGLNLQHLYRRWMHSYEEDSGSEVVYRSSPFRFPRSRGRTGFEIRADGTVTISGIAATDGPATTEGKWRIEGGNTLIFTNRRAEPIQVFHILSLDSDRLIIRK